MRWFDIIPGFGDRKSRKMLDQVFSRRMLGSIMLGGSLSKVQEKIIGLIAPQTAGKLVSWIFAAIIWLYIFVYWDKIAEAGKEKAKESKEKVKEKVEDK